MNKTLTATQYYLALAYFMVASQAQAEVRKFAERLLKVVKDDFVVDEVYNPEISATKENFDKILEQRGIQVDWLSDDKKKKKESNNEQI